MPPARSSRRRVPFAATLLAFAFAFSSCGEILDFDDPDPVPPPTPPLVLAAGTDPLAPAQANKVSPGLDLARLGLRASDVSAVYELTTPVGEPFQFHALSRAAGNEGTVELFIGHVAAGVAPPAAGIQSLAEAGFAPSVTGTSGQGDWLRVAGDGFSRATLQGSIRQDQVLAIKAASGASADLALVQLRIGPRSEINPEIKPAGGAYAGIEDSRSLYSSKSWWFGHPTVAVSGDRTSVVCYEGDQDDIYRYASKRYEMRLQYDGATGKVTGGGSEDAGADTGHWRDHEIAALYNVLVLVRSGGDGLTVRISLDRGASFGQEKTIATRGTCRLAQLAMAMDYTLGLSYWDEDEAGRSVLSLVEARPSSLDQGGSPTAFAFDDPKVVYRDGSQVTPAIMGMAYSEGGDLVLGYAFTRFTWETQPTGRPRTTTHTQYRCAVRPWASAFQDGLVEETVAVSLDPSVSLLGSGSALRIFYAYETAQGVVLRTSGDQGRTWSAGLPVGGRFGHEPAVLARRQGGRTRVDLLYLDAGDQGRELHLAHWDDFDTGAFELHPLARSSFNTVATRTAVPSSYGEMIQVGWLGYDACLDGDDVVLVYHEEAIQPVFICGLGLDPLFRGIALGAPAAAPFVPAAPPPLAPGMTKPIPAPDPTHPQRLEFLRLD